MFFATPSQTRCIQVETVVIGLRFCCLFDANFCLSFTVFSLISLIYLLIQLYFGLILNKLTPSGNYRLVFMKAYVQYMQCIVFIFRIHPKEFNLAGFPFFAGMAVYCYEV